MVTCTVAVDNWGLNSAVLVSDTELARSPFGPPLTFAHRVP